MTRNEYHGILHDIAGKCNSLCKLWREEEGEGNMNRLVFVFISLSHIIHAMILSGVIQMMQLYEYSISKDISDSDMHSALSRFHKYEMNLTNMW